MSVPPAASSGSFPDGIVDCPSTAPRVRRHHAGQGGQETGRAGRDLARGKNRRPREKVAVEIETITAKPWVRRVIRWDLTGDRPKDLRLSWSIDQDARAALDEEIFGKHVLITSHDDWPAAEVIAGYRPSPKPSSPFRQLEDPHVVSFSPMHHWTDHDIRVHVFTCVLALQLAHLMRYRARQHGLDLSVRELLGQLRRHRRDRADLPPPPAAGPKPAA